MSNTLQEQLQEKYDAVEKRITEIEGLKNEAYKTNCNFRYNPTNSYSSLDIDSTMNEAELIHAYAFVTNKAKQYHEAAEAIGLAEYPVFKWCGFAPEDWQHDIKLRFKMIRHHSQLSVLKDAKQKMLPFLPQENKIKQLLLEIPTV